MLTFGKTKETKEKFYVAKNGTKIWDVNIDNIVISKLVKTRTNSKYLVEYLDKAIKLLVSIMFKLSGYVKTFKAKDADKNKNNKLMSFRIDDENLLEKYNAIWTKTEDFKNIELNVLPDHDDRCIKTKIKTYDDKFCTNCRVLNVPEDDIECGSFTVISIDSLFVYEKKYYLQVYLDNCSYKVANRQMRDYLDDKRFED